MSRAGSRWAFGAKPTSTSPEPGRTPGNESTILWTQWRLWSVALEQQKMHPKAKASPIRYQPSNCLIPGVNAKNSLSASRHAPSVRGRIVSSSVSPTDAEMRVFHNTAGESYNASQSAQRRMFFMKPAMPDAAFSRMSFPLTIGALVLASLLFHWTSIAQANPPVGNPHQSKGTDQTRSELLRERLQQLNRDISKKGLHDFPQSMEKLLTGYAYGEFFDWDLYFENIYLSYYGVSKFDFSNFAVFLSRQQPDGFISRTLGITYPKPKQMFKPFLAQLAVLGSQQTGSYEWLRKKDYGQLQKYLDRWFAYDADHNGLPTWNSSDASGMDNQLSRSGDLDSYFDEGVDLACYLV